MLAALFALLSLIVGFAALFALFYVGHYVTDCVGGWIQSRYGWQGRMTARRRAQLIAVFVLFYLPIIVLIAVLTFRVISWAINVR